MTSMRPCALFALLGVMTASLVACATDLKGERFGNNKPGALVGVPVTMTRPQFDVTYTAPASETDDPTVVLDLHYVSDFTRRYMLKLKPDWLSSAGLDLSIGAQGQLTSVNGTSTSGAAAAVQTLGKLVVAAVTTGAFDQESATQELSKTLSATSMIATSSMGTRSCAPSDPAAPMRAVPTQEPTDEEKAERAELVKRLNAVATGDVSADTLRYLNDGELRWLIAARCTLENDLSASRGRATSEIGAAVNEATQAGIIADDPLLKNVAKLANAATKESERAIGMARLRQAIAGSGLQPTDPRLIALNNLVGKLELLASLAPGPALRQASALVDMSPAEWRRRNVKAIQGELAALQVTARLRGCEAPNSLAGAPDANTGGSSEGPNSPECRRLLTRRTTLREDLAVTLDRVMETRSMDNLRSRIARGASSGDLDPHVYARTAAALELAAASVDKAVASLATPAPSPPKETRFSAAPILNGTQTQGEKEAQWVLEQVVGGLPETATELPRFVIVIDKENLR